MKNNYVPFYESDITQAHRRIALKFIQYINNKLELEKNIDDYIGYRNGKSLETKNMSQIDERYKYSHYGNVLYLSHEEFSEEYSIELIETVNYPK